MPKTSQTLFAFDKSARSYDADKRLHVSATNISKAAVNPYLGSEIPNWQQLGLESGKIYKLFRDPDELAKAAPTFNNLPLLSKHVPVDADDHRPDLVVGSTGSDASFKPPYLQTSLVVWARDAIDGIETQRQKELSSAYRYTAVMEPGEYNGEMYDGRMTNIIGNHVALVEVGRAGPDVVVGDSNPFEDTPMKFNKKQFDAKVKPLLAQDSALTFERFVSLAKIGVDVVKPCLAQDAKIEDAELEALVASASEIAQDAVTVFSAFSDEEKAAIKAKFFAADEDPAIKPKVAADEDDEDEDDQLKPEAKTAMDAAIAAASANAEANAMKKFSAIRKAEKDVAPLVGEVAAMDSAEEIYKFALDSANVDTTGVDPSAFPAMVKLVISQKSGVQPDLTIAQDAASAATDFATMFPDAKVPARAF